MARRRALNSEHLTVLGNYEQAKTSIGDYFGRGRPGFRERAGQMHSRFERRLAAAAEIGNDSHSTGEWVLLDRARPVINTRGNLLLGQPLPRTMRH